MHLNGAQKKYKILRKNKYKKIKEYASLANYFKHPNLQINKKFEQRNILYFRIYFEVYTKKRVFPKSNTFNRRNKKSVFAFFFFTVLDGLVETEKKS